MADFGTLSEDRWPAALKSIRQADVLVVEEGTERGIRGYGCHLGRARVNLDYVPSDPGREVRIYCGVLECYRRPVQISRLFRRIRAAIHDVGGVWC